MNLNIKKKFILSFFAVFFTAFSMKGASANNTSFIPPKQNKNLFLTRLQILSKNNPSMFTFLGGLGAHYIFKKAANNIYKQIALPVVTWSLGHTIFLLMVTNDKQNISKIFSPFPPKKLQTHENWLNQEFNCFPIIDFAKKIISNNQDRINNKISNFLASAKKNSLLAAWATFGFASPLLYKKLESHFIKKILWYVLIQESLTLAAFLTQKKNKNTDEIKKYLLRHKNPNSEIDFCGSPIKIYPIFNFGLDFINTAFFKQDIINQFLAQPFIKELETELKDLKDLKPDMTEKFTSEIYENPTRQSLKQIKDEISKIKIKEEPLLEEE